MEKIKILVQLLVLFRISMVSIKMFPQGISSGTLGSTEATDDLWMGHMVSLNMDTEVLS